MIALVRPTPAFSASVLFKLVSAEKASLTSRDHIYLPDFSDEIEITSADAALLAITERARRHGEETSDSLAEGSPATNQQSMKTVNWVASPSDSHFPASATFTSSYHQWERKATHTRTTYTTTLATRFITPSRTKKYHTTSKHESKTGVSAGSKATKKASTFEALYVSRISSRSAGPRLNIITIDWPNGNLSRSEGNLSYMFWCQFVRAYY